MGKAARWFRGLLGLKKEDSLSQKAAKPPKRRWSFVKSYREREHATANDTADNRLRYSNGNGRPATPGYADCDGGVDPNKHAIAVAAASAAVADAAVAAAQAAAEVVRLTSSGRSNTTTATSAVYVTGASCGVREDWAAVKIQAHFRGYLARRALRALKGLVKLQALVRGYIVRKQTTDMLRRMEVLLRAQKRARAGRTQISESPQSSSKLSQFLHPGPATPEKFEHAIRSKSTKQDQLQMLKRNGSKSIGRVDSQSDAGSWDQRGLLTKTGQAEDENSDRILEVDTGKTHPTPNRKIFIHQATHRASASDQFSHSFSTSKDSTTHQTGPSLASCEVHSLNPLKSTDDAPESPFCSGNNSPQFYSASSRGGSSKRGPFTPTKSDGSRSYLSGYSDHPSYMAYTESSRAKVRSFSAPKQRPHFERSVSTKRHSVHGRDESRLSTQRVSSVHTNFVNKAYLGSGRLDRLGMPVRVDTAGLNADHWRRY